MTSLTSSEFRVGERMPGTNWVVRGVLGSGGMGVVLDVEKEASGVRMAMKVVRPAFARSAEFVEQFSEEVRVLARLRHPNIVEVTDCDALADGSPYIMMERLQGRTLRDAMRDPQITLTAENVWNIVGPLCRALHCAHTEAVPIVHRDVKPGNVFLDERRHFASRIKLIDFGISAVLDGTRASGAAMGTVRYMAPEACRGEAPTPKVDLYALGVMVYEVLTRSLPWDVDARRSDAMMDAHLNREPMPASRRAAWIPPSVDACLAQALRKDPRERQRHVREFYEQLGQLPLVDDGSGNHQTEGVTAPTPETLAHGRAGAPAASLRRATVVSSGAGDSVSLDLASLDEASGPAALEDSSARSDASVATPMSIASPPRPAARSGAWRAAWLGAPAALLAAALSGHWMARATPNPVERHVIGSAAGRGSEAGEIAPNAQGSGALRLAPSAPVSIHHAGPAMPREDPGPPLADRFSMSAAIAPAAASVASPPAVERTKKPLRARPARALSDEDLLFVPEAHR